MRPNSSSRACAPSAAVILFAAPTLLAVFAPGATSAQTWRAEPSELRRTRSAVCVEQALSCNSRVTTQLDTTDCNTVTSPGVHWDFHQFQGIAGQTVTIDVQSDDFKTASALSPPGWTLAGGPGQTLVAGDNGAGRPGNDVRYRHTLDESGTWTFGVGNPQEPGALGEYTVRLTCEAASAEPLAPSGLEATATSSTEIQLSWQDNSTDEDEFRLEMKPTTGDFELLAVAAADATSGTASDLQPGQEYSFRVRAQNGGGSSAWSQSATATTFAGSPTPCAAEDDVTCLNDGRFQVEVTWRDFAGNTGRGQVVPFGSDDSGLFWFFSADNWEMLVKVLDACAIGDRYWVFAAATTDVEYTLTVTDSDTGASKSYFNPLGKASAAVTDSDAFATCP